MGKIVKLISFQDAHKYGVYGKSRNYFNQFNSSLTVPTSFGLLNPQRSVKLVKGRSIYFSRGKKYKDNFREFSLTGLTYAHKMTIRLVFWKLNFMLNFNCRFNYFTLAEE